MMGKAARLALISFLALAPLSTARAMSSNGVFTTLGGFTDNVPSAPNGSQQRDSSVTGRAAFDMELEWQGPRSDAFYLDLDSDFNLQLNESDDSSLYFKIGPGYRLATGGTLDLDLGYSLAKNIDFDDDISYSASGARATNVYRNPPLPGAPRFVGPTRSADSFLNHELHVEGLHDFGTGSVGPALRFGFIDYDNIPMDDSYVTLGGLLRLEPSRAFAFGGELGYMDYNADFSPLSFSGMFLGMGASFELTSLIVARGMYRYASRDYEDNLREDTNHQLTFGLANRYTKTTTLSIEYTRVCNDSNSPGSEYNTNVVMAGLAMDLF